jgi:hypothetical protein
MNSAKPPRLAAWILQEFGPERNQEALTGDLNEAFQHGRSKRWYWRQVVAAIRWRRLLYRLLILAAWSWWLSSSTWWRSSPLVSRPLDMTIFMAVLLACRYLPGMLRGKKLRAALAVVVMFFCWLYWYHFDVAQHYSICVILFVLSYGGHRKALPPVDYPLTMREPVYGDPDAERDKG